MRRLAFSLHSEIKKDLVLTALKDLFVIFYCNLLNLMVFRIHEFHVHFLATLYQMKSNNLFHGRFEIQRALSLAVFREIPSGPLIKIHFLQSGYYHVARSRNGAVL